MFKMTRCTRSSSAQNQIAFGTLSSALHFICLDRCLVVQGITHSDNEGSVAECYEGVLSIK